MKKYLFEASRSQLEKPTEPKEIFVTTAKTIVYAETKEEAYALAAEKLNQTYFGTGTLLGNPVYIAEWEIPVDWNYEKTGEFDLETAFAELNARSVIR